MDKRIELNDKELAEINAGIDLPGLEGIGPYPYVAGANPQRDLDIVPTGSDTGTTSDNNIPAPDISPKSY
ncbi:MAG: hypothetical protein MJ111_01570 [Clostridia bacterium]|nr:hypothetical protein [Clostridia bacterium]